MTDRQAGAEKQKIEVTPEMIEAGEAVFDDWRAREDRGEIIATDLDELVREIYTALKPHLSE